MNDKWTLKDLDDHLSQLKDPLEVLVEKTKQVPPSDQAMRDMLNIKKTPPRQV